MDQLGPGGNLGTARRCFSRSRNSNSRTLAFGGYTTAVVANAQKNMMELLGQQEEI
jgi:hypothetical protein